MGDPQKGEVKDDPWVSRLSSFMGVSTAYSEGENWERRHWDGKMMSSFIILAFLGCSKP